MLGREVDVIERVFAVVEELVLRVALGALGVLDQLPALPDEGDPIGGLGVTEGLGSGAFGDGRAAAPSFRARRILGHKERHQALSLHRLRDGQATELDECGREVDGLHGLIEDFPRRHAPGTP